ncbi:MAG: CpsD/CapB family tyrosine-protein kinase [Paenibacillaceae bacterium]|uniref:CpsD/CapB family tyrosine-protein kinase n=1 Tax=Paenibacillus cymbidii TaxID=1639034 RepID=UPI0010819E7F|nr:CpsD/CapB family tyrosine-protein kinase [Paenibacillus cymbidii]MBO9605738.1 CpsD/CapB family tyrosine-protein kinase [Paenibacillaceae bacterium]
MPMFRSIDRYPLVSQSNADSPLTEMYRALRTKLRIIGNGQPAQVLVVTSATAGEGKSLTTANLAITFALEGKKTLIVDADMRKPALHQAFLRANRVGLASVLDESCTVSEAIRTTDIDRLQLVTAGNPLLNPAELIGSGRMLKVVEELRGMYDVILIDCPPLLTTSEAQLLSLLADGVLLVVRSGKVKRRAVERAKSMLEQSGARLFGAVLNHVGKHPGDVRYYGT